MGAVVGMVVITPACGYVSTGGAFICGIVGGLFCNIMSSILGRSNHVHDQLDVFAAHGTTQDHSTHPTNQLLI